MKLFAVTAAVLTLSLCATAAKGSLTAHPNHQSINDFRNVLHTIAHGRQRLLCSSEFDCAGGLACIPQQKTKSGSSKTCGAASTSGLCDGYADCGTGIAKTHRCKGNNATHHGTCAAKAAIDEACDTDHDKYASLLSHTYSAQCDAKTAYCKDGVCAALEPAGTACSDGVKCDGYCDGASLFGNNDGTCKPYKKTGEACTKPNECGGNDPPYSWAACSVEEGASEGKCVDVGEEIEGFFKRLLGLFIAIIVVAVLALVGCIWFCCCRRKKSQVVVVQAQPGVVVQGQPVQQP